MSYVNGLYGGTGSSTSSTTLDDFVIRVAEYHRHVAPSPGLADPRHYDMDSLVTVDMMLCNGTAEADGGDLGDADFEGGRFACMEWVRDETGMKKEAPVDKGFDQKGTLVAFPSHKYHCVSPVTKGERRVLVLEFWNKSSERRRCNHRCTSF